MFEVQIKDMIQRYTIKEVNRPHPLQVVSANDFRIEEAGEIEPEVVLCDPRFSLYCFDLEKNAAVFVEVADSKAVDHAPFYYQAQIDHAVGLVSMPMETFHSMAREIAEPADGLIFIHSTGRCGSTLLSKALQAVPSVHSLSEPDDMTQLVLFRSDCLVPDDWLRSTISSSIKWRFKARSEDAASRVAIKTRAEVMGLSDLITSSIGPAKHLFLYRDGISWVRSVFQGKLGDGVLDDPKQNRDMEERWSHTLPMIREYRREDTPMNPIQIRILSWITAMEAYLSLRETGVPICAARFEDITSHSIPMLKQIFSFCGIDGVNWDEVGMVLGRDSQAGTVFDREERRKFHRELPDSFVSDAREMIAGRTLLRTSDVVLPGTVSLPT